ncbi:MAG: phosphoethanolamine--lipid A transferase [Comamonadaceae bacterium]|nr:MAG: phosphoethanolamine--lipid A transferase [Comamonadaceae bacterium]
MTKPGTNPSVKNGVENGVENGTSARQSAGRHPAWLILAASLWLATVCNIPLWKGLGQLSTYETFQGAAFAVAMALIIAGTMAAIASLFAWRRTLKPALSLFMLMAALGLHFMLSYQVVIDPNMMVNALQTDPREVRDLIGMRLLVTLLVLWVLPTLALWRWQVDYGRWPRRLAHNSLQVVASLLAVTALLFASFGPLASTMRNHREVRYLINPLNSVYALASVAAKPFQRDESVVLPLGRDAHVVSLAGTTRPPLLVLVLGETGRSGNFGLNGYGRDTTPELAARLVTSFTDAWSCGTSTAESVPCMFSDLGREAYPARKHNTEGLLDVVEHAGMAVLWLDNQSGCKGVCDRIGSTATSNLNDPQLCPGNECFDGIMLKDLDARIAALPAERRAQGVVVVMHQLGSHGPAYTLRSPAAYKRFKPECTSSDLQSCSKQELANAYDNSVAYTDHFLAATIDWLKEQQTYAGAMVYVADHGESLGENNLYLHGMPYMVAPDVQKHVPWINWFSQPYAARTGLSEGCLRESSGRNISHDNYFHSVLGLLSIQTAVYRQTMDVYAPCRKSSIPVADAAPVAGLAGT